ncbi:MAG: hypothetical protein AAGG08_13045, partial [Actinomycetota bacterium]
MRFAVALTVVATGFASLVLPDVSRASLDDPFEEPMVVADINTSPLSSFGGGGVTAGDVVFFRATDGQRGDARDAFEFDVSDGSLRKIPIGDGEDVRSLAAFRDGMVMSVRRADNDYDLRYVEPGGTPQVLASEEDRPSQIVAGEERLYYVVGFSNSDQTIRTVAIGEVATTVRSFSGRPGITDLTPVQVPGVRGEGLFFVFDGSGGREPAFLGAGLIRFDLAPGPADSDVGDVEVIDGDVWFRAFDDRDLFVFDAAMAADPPSLILADAERMVVADDLIYVQQPGGLAGTTDLLTIDTGTRNIEVIATVPTSSVLLARGVGRDALLRVDDDWRLLSPDGDLTTLLFDGAPLVADRTDSRAVLSGSGRTLMLKGVEPDSSRSLFEVDVASLEVTRLDPDGEWQGPSQPTQGSTPPVGDESFLLPHFTDQLGTEPWLVPGSGQTPRLIRDLDPRTDSSFPQEFQVGDGVLYFFAQPDGTARLELYRYEPDTDVVVADDLSFPGGSGSSIGFFDGSWFRAGLNSSDTPALFRSTDGVVAEIGVLPSTVIEMYDVIDDRLIFDRQDALQAIDLSTGVTALLGVEIEGSSGGASASGGFVFRSDRDASPAEEPWVTDGTPAGTRPLGDLVPGADGSRPLRFTPFGNLVAFEAATTAGAHVTDG